MAAATPKAALYTVITIVAWWLAALEGPRLRPKRCLGWSPGPPLREILGRAIRVVLRGLIVANLAVAAVQAGCARWACFSPASRAPCRWAC